MKNPLYIWGEQIPGNNKRLKTDVLNIHEEYTPHDLFEKYPGVWDKSSDELGDLSGNDTLVYRQEIEHGPAELTYTDRPFLLPYLSEGSDQAVVICPGGAYLTKSMVTEGEQIAELLNEAGISAFVLWYRSYPYREPIMFLDAQRAIRYVRYHAADFGINPNKIGLLGFSAGGNLAGVTSLLLRNQDWFQGLDYQLDKIDREDASISALGLIYPAISLYKDKIVAILAGADSYRDPVTCQAIADRLDMRNGLQNGDAPLFICAAVDDEVVPAQHCLDLVQKANEKRVSAELHLFAQGGHGFGACRGEQMPQFYHDWSLVRQWKDLYLTWLKTVWKE